MCVSIIIPIYNLQDHIEACLDSVTKQSYSDLQIILVDDGSTDNSFKICKQYAQKDSRIVVIHQENRGVSAARNAGLRKATGDYVSFIDGDDIIAPDYIEVYLAQAEATGADIIIGGLTKKESGKTSWIKPLAGMYNTQEFLSLLCRKGTVIYGYVWCKLYCLSMIKDHQVYFNETMKSQEDLDFALSVYRIAQKVCCFDYCGYYYEYTPPTRKTWAGPILGNQIKLYNIAKEADVDTSSLVPRFQSMLYTWIYHADSVQDINNIININIPDALLEKISCRRWEVRHIIKLTRKKKAKSIYRYFVIRRKLRTILVMLQLVKPID